ncbi:MAG TPA: chloride channel protein [Actinospica sp.]|jgi:CIC family chloride channel protein|nr:chloride channel protein [Actinospica sp.]
MAQANAARLPGGSRPQAAAGYLRSSQGGLFLLAVLVGVGSGLGAVVFRYLISSFTWLATGHSEFGQQGRVASAHFSILGPAFFVVIPVLGGLLYGPLIYRWAREARGHGVPEVMIAVAENGGRIRPQVSVVKALASALCIASGGSVGREGPIVQIGSAMASSLGQRIRMPENRLRILVACGAAGGISATFNAPITGVFFGVEIILRAFSVEAMFPVMLAAMLADVVAEPFLGSGRFLSGFPAGISLHHPANYLLIALLAVVAAFVGLGFKTVLYKLEDLGDELWGKRPEWARPAVGGVLLGLILLAVPQLYGVGYPVMYKAIAGGYALWFLILLTFGKMLATSVSLGIGGSGGVFAPSLFLGVMSGTAYGVIVDHVFGAVAGPPALYAAVAMGAVFTSAARAPLTSLASVVEMTGDFTLTLPVMLAVAIATTISRGVSYGTIYTTKLLRRGTDLDKSSPWRALADVKLADAMRPLPAALSVTDNGHTPVSPEELVAALPGQVTHERTPQALYASESLSQALRQLVLYGRDGLPVLSADGARVEGWVTNASAMHAIARDLGAATAASTRAELEADLAAAHQPTDEADSPNPLTGYRVIEVLVGEDSRAIGKSLDAVDWPAGHIPVSVLHRRVLHEADPGLKLTVGDRVNLLVRQVDEPDHDGAMLAMDSMQGG